MSGRIAIAIGLLAGLAFAGIARADSLSEGIAAMPGAVEDIRIAGTWEKDGKSGAYRVVTARTGGEMVTARFFIQWVSYDAEGGAKVDASTEITEVAEQKIDILDYTSESDTDGLSIYIVAGHSGDDAEENYELHVKSPSDYRFGPATN